ncbi:hypothetical protein BDQ17DRAFT_1523139 [Cyathus striatus]|nr:hypothetical protein BDQ17DRAFT_1523139 [Cyathus striatus]
MAGRHPADKHPLADATTVWIVGGLISCPSSARSSFSTTLKALNKLISLSIETAFPAVTIATAALISFLKYPGTNFDLFFYANALFGVLNRRAELRRIVSGTIPSTDIRAAVGSNNRLSQADSP